MPGERLVPAGRSDPIALTIGALRGWSGVREVIEATVREDMDELLDDYGYLPFGLPSLRSALARMLTVSGVPTTMEQILITGGGQQAIHLLVDQLAGPEGVVAIEDPDLHRGARRHPGRRRVHGARCRSVPTGSVSTS